ncbi:unnamed protein product [Rhizophagus irregularis]|nr:unnamed protein product [Rhizophagus irregularis]CAB5377807.1 unnamed protein product [Rhizophagus irregularis]
MAFYKINAGQHHRLHHRGKNLLTSLLQQRPLATTTSSSLSSSRQKPFIIMTSLSSQQKPLVTTSSSSLKSQKQLVTASHHGNLHQPSISSTSAAVSPLVPETKFIM